ncbi:MAG: hypothetical protein ACFFBD_00600 [Candidatus Hodarchaeota archaeon]
MNTEREEKNENNRQKESLTGLTGLFGTQDPKKCRYCNRPAICSEPGFICCYLRGGKQKDCLTCSDRLCRKHFKQKIEKELS